MALGMRLAECLRMLPADLDVVEGEAYIGGTKTKTVSAEMTNDTVTPYRPVGPAELDLIRQFGFSRFPPRLPDQPIFYAVVQEDTPARSLGTGM